MLGGLDFLESVADTDDLSLTSITDLAKIDVGARTFLIVVSRSGDGMLTSFEIDAHGSLLEVDRVETPFLPAAGAVNRLIVPQGGDDQKVYLTGADQGQVFEVSIDASGIIQGFSPLSLTASEQLSFDQITVGVGSSGIIVEASPGEGALISFAPDAAGALHEVDRLTAQNAGLAVAGEMTLIPVALDGQSYVILGATSTSTLSVAQVEPDGTMHLVDHVMDTRDTRFGGVQELASLTHNGRTFVAGAGSDDGVAMFEVVPGGTLRHIVSREDDTKTGLSGVSALALTEVNAHLHLSVASSSEPGLSTFTLDISAIDAPIVGDSGGNTLAGSAQDDLMDGGAGHDHLDGGAGEDVLIDGSGQDSLTGGAGADVFIFALDGERDVIADFERGVDQLDLSHWPFLYTSAQLSWSPSPEGAAITYADEELMLITHDGRPMTQEDIDAIALSGPSRIAMTPFSVSDVAHEADAVEQLGSEENDTLSGSLGDDSLLGLDGDDVLTGFAGTDTLAGYLGNDTIFGDFGSDHLLGGPGNDRIEGGLGFDTIYGDDGDDYVLGGYGFDRIEGGHGDDTIIASNGSDLIWGNDGDDEIYGGVGFDTIYGDAGDDVIDAGAGYDSIFGAAGDDRVYASAGNDWISGGSGDDTIFGGIANDFIDGGTGDDSLLGERGRDTIAGGDGDDILDGGYGPDYLSGGAGDDTLRGGTNFDTLDGGSGNDVLHGDTGQDTFIFRSGQDNIVSFDAGKDTLQLDRALLGGRSADTRSLEHFVGRDGGDLVLYFSQSNALTLGGIDSLDLISSDIDFI